MGGAGGLVVPHGVGFLSRMSKPFSPELVPGYDLSHASWPFCQPGHLAPLSLVLMDSTPIPCRDSSVLGTKESSFAENVAALERSFLCLFFLPGTETTPNYPIQTQPMKAAVFQEESGNKPRNK